MRRHVAIAVVIAIAAMIAAGSADARHRHQINPTPFSHSPCSVLSGRPCTPYYCGVFNHGPCIPEIDYPYGENLQLTIETVPSKDDAAKYQKPDHDLDSIGDLFAEVLQPRESGREVGAPERGVDLHHTVAVDLDEAMRGGHRTLTVTRQERCHSCRVSNQQLRSNHHGHAPE